MSSNLESYENNLASRLTELRRGDPAYILHTNAIIEAIAILSATRDPCDENLHILDVGCGLGFTTKAISEFTPEVIGVDLSLATIKLAKQEHSNITFYESSGESFNEIMIKETIDRFNIAVVSMVLHSINDGQVLQLLKGIKQCLVPGGALIGVIPTPAWLQTKLIEYARDEIKMSSEEGVPWVAQKLAAKEVKLKVKVKSSTKYWPDPVTIYNRSEGEYGELLRRSGFGATVIKESGTDVRKAKLSYYKPLDNLHNYELYKRKRSLFVTFAEEK